MVTSPDFAPGTRRRDRVSPIDLAPTLLDLAGAEPLAVQDGRSLVREAPADRPLFAESIQFGFEMRSVQVGDYKLIQYVDRRGYFAEAARFGDSTFQLDEPDRGRAIP